MAGRMWRHCVVFSVFLAWQVGSAQALVNLIEPRVAAYAPRTDLFIKLDGEIDAKHWAEPTSWQVIDRDPSTYITLTRGKRLRLIFTKGDRWGDQPYTLAATKLRITLAAHAREQDVPLAWNIKRGYSSVGGPPEGLRRSEIKNGKFEVKFKAPPRYKPRFGRPDHFQIKFYKESGVVPIAEIELLGPRKALDTLWPDGKYPCSQRLEMINPVKGKLFSVAKNNVSKKTLEKIFSSNVEHDPTDTPRRRKREQPPFDYDGMDPVIIGVEFEKAPTVHEVMLHELRWYTLQGVDRIVLQANACKPNCSTGWITLEEKDSQKQSFHRKSFLEPFYLETPGKYKAYRVLFYPLERNPKARTEKPKRMSVSSIFFLGCNKDD